MHWKTFARLVMMFSLCTVLICTNLQGAAAQTPEKPVVGYKAPSFTLDIFSTRDTYELHQHNKPVLISFWASWCEHCHAQASLLKSIHEQYADELDVLLINLSAQDTERGIRQFKAQLNASIPLLLDPDGVVSKKYHVLAVPTTYFIHANGIIQAKIQGVMDENTLHQHLQQLQKN